MAGRKRNPKAKIAEDGYEYRDGFLIRRIETTAGIRYQTDLGKQGGKYVRRSFKTLNEARGCARSRKVELEQHGHKAKSLSDSQRLDSVEALDTLKEFGTTLRAAAAFYAKHHKEVDHRNGVGHLIEAYLKEQAKRVEVGTLRPRTHEDTTKRLKPLKETLGHLAIDAVDTEDIRELLEGYKPLNASNYKRYISMFFRWANKKKLVKGNPVDGLDPIPLDNDAPEIYSPKQVKAIMGACIDGDKPRKEMLPYFALAFFGGIRPDEIKRLGWGDIDLEEGVIHIRAAVSKTRTARFLEMPRNLRQWLATCPDRTGLVFPWSETSCRRWRAEAYKTAGVPSIQDGARHSMATYYLALHGRDETTELLGHSDKVLFRHYKGLVKGRKTKARDYFSITPDKGAKIIQLQQAV